jgi:predicted Zn-dependent peptidase
VGDISPEAVYRVAKKRLKKEKPVKIERKFEEEPQAVAQKRSEQKLSVSVPLFGIGFKDSAPGLGLGHIRRDAVTKILLELIAGEGSSLYQKLYAKGLINPSFGTEYMSGESYGLSIFTGESKDPDAVLAALLEELDELRKTGVGAQDFERCRRVVYGRAVSAFNSVEKIANSAISCYFLGATVIDTVDVFFDVTLAQVNDRLREHFTAEKSAMSVILPL